MSAVLAPSDVTRGEKQLYGYLCPSARAIAVALPELDADYDDLIEARRMLVTAIDAQRRESRRSDLAARWIQEARKGVVLLMLAAGAIEDALDAIDPSWTTRRNRR